MKKPNRKEVRGRLRDAGVRVTAPRVAVLQLLLASERPLSHMEVVHALRSGHWDQATLYRNLVKLVEANLARVTSRVTGVVRYEAQRPGQEQHEHPHFECRECGWVDCLPGVELTVQGHTWWHQGMVDAGLQIVGTCPDCRTESSPNPSSPRRRTKAARKH